MTAGLLLLALASASVGAAAPLAPPTTLVQAGHDLDLDLLLCQAVREQQLMEYRRREYEYYKDDLLEKLDGGKPVSHNFITRYIHRSRPDGIAVNEVVERDRAAAALEEGGDGKADVERRLKELRDDPEALARALEEQRKDSLEKVRQMQPNLKALIFRLEGVDEMDGEPCWVVSFRPNPAWKGDKGSFERSQGVLWVRMEHPAFLRAELTFLENMSVKFGPFATLSPGTYMLLQVSDVAAGGPAMTKSLDLDLKLRLFLLFRRYERRGTYYREYRKVNDFGPEYVP